MNETFLKVLSILLTPITLIWTGIYMIPRPFRDVKKPNTLPPATDAAFPTQDAAQAAGGGWYVTMNEDFVGSALPSPWVPSPHGLRNTEYWCDNMVDASEDGKIKVLAAHLTDNQCDVCKQVEGDFTSGIETRKMVDGKSVDTFDQAFGYYEARVKLPEGPGLWSAFWLQTNTMGQVGNFGRDGSEIDVYESAFYYDRTKLGNCIHWDGYGKMHRDHGTITDTGIDQYDGWHTYGLLWTPESYTFFLDGKAMWQTSAGGVCRVPAFLRLTVEIRHVEYGPYGAKLGEFVNTRDNPSVFEIDYVKVYQHTDFLKSIRTPESYKKMMVPWFLEG